MKKVLVTLFSIIISIIFLTGCQEKQKTQTASHATLTIQFDKKTVKTYKNLIVTTDETVLDCLKSESKVTVESGVITKIDDISQVEKSNLYWLFKVNGKLSDKGAAETPVRNGDKIEFYLGKFE
ncbi:DUF4430 domain-containing protein [Pseudolactococcus insecticola]|uniref:Transcobalamin-like C-terminal domain-containing protein n=1 Tax=Pseudolactococcus insecticola TaxID=2709158 RepID=A0A6A0B4H8_9LACT|nr:DUF4430 domain-containing protein [Lactococcus insecticola]GFH39605.1 hypothetical protein Hs20B_00030 [Lactococcus insecticola]